MNARFRQQQANYSNFLILQRRILPQDTEIEKIARMIPIRFAYRSKLLSVFTMVVDCLHVGLFVVMVREEGQLDQLVSCVARVVSWCRVPADRTARRLTLSLTCRSRARGTWFFAWNPSCARRRASRWPPRSTARRPWRRRGTP